MRSKQEAIDFFTYRAPTDETAPKHAEVSVIFLQAVEQLWDVIPDGPGKTYAFRKLSDARMAFNSAIAHDGQ